MTANVLLIDDELAVRSFLRHSLDELGCRVVEAETADAARNACDESIDLVLLDHRLPDASGLDLLNELKAKAPGSLIIVMSAYSSVANAVTAMKDGAFHYAEKPLDLSQLMGPIRQALELTRLRQEVRELRAREAAPYGFGSMLGDSPEMHQVRALMKKLAETDSTTVLLLGESGTGKDLAAKIIHYNSARASRRFVNITCSALPDHLLESQLFGYEQGAFTDAKSSKEGLLEIANGGTVFLDEIGEMSTILQAKLLRFLEERAFLRVGGAQDIRVDVRIVAATNRNLDEEVARGRFREDLYYRLKVVPVELPPLRERRSDIRRLLVHFADHFARSTARTIRGYSDEALSALERYPWPGNVREMRNAVERAVLFAATDILVREDFPLLHPTEAVPTGFRLPPEGIKLRDLERRLVEQAMELSGGNQTKAAKLLGMSRDQLRYRIAKFEVEDAEAAEVHPQEIA
jgi:DNA-binding NtrC family response regulator